MGAVIHVAFNRIHGQLVAARTSSLILLAQPLRTTIQYAVCLSHDILQVNICILVMRRSWVISSRSTMVDQAPELIV